MAKATTQKAWRISACIAVCAAVLAGFTGAGSRPVATSTAASASAPVEAGDIFSQYREAVRSAFRLDWDGSRLGLTFNEGVPGSTPATAPGGTGLGAASAPGAEEKLVEVVEGPDVFGFTGSTSNRVVVVRDSMGRQTIRHKDGTADRVLIPNVYPWQPLAVLIAAMEEPYHLKIGKNFERDSGFFLESDRAISMVSIDRKTDGAMSFFINGKGPRPRSVLVMQRGWSSLEIHLIIGNEIVILVQQGLDNINGYVKVGVSFNRFSARNFLELWKTRREFVEKTLLPGIEAYGLTAPPLPTGPEISRTVLEYLRGVMNPDEDRRANDLLKRLAGPSYAGRQEAYGILRQYFTRYRAHITRALSAPESSVELKTRLESIIAERIREDRYFALIEAERLISNPSYLAGVLKDAPPDARAFVVRKLQLLTGKDIGDDAEAWARQTASRPATGPAR